MTATGDDPKVPAARAEGLRRAATRPARRVLDAYSGEHGVYGVVLVTALIGAAPEEDTDLDVLVFVFGTVLVFWLAHVYAAVVASRSPAHGRGESVGQAIRSGARHSAGMLWAMLVPAALLGLGVWGVMEEDLAYVLALLSGVVLLALIGYANAARNRSPWYVRIIGTLTTTLLGLVVITFSIIAH